jgi:hypothetical protein
MKYLSRQVVFILLIPLSIWSCTPITKGIQLSKTSDELQKEVNRFISIGMSIQKAQQILESSDFKCEDYKNDVFAAEKRDANGQLINTRTVQGDFLLCSIGSYFMATTSWSVAVLYKKSRVTMVHAVIHYQNF